MGCCLQGWTMSLLIAETECPCSWVQLYGACSGDRKSPSSYSVLGIVGIGMGMGIGGGMSSFS